MQAVCQHDMLDVSPAFQGWPLCSVEEGGVMAGGEEGEIKA